MFSDNVQDWLQGSIEWYDGMNRMVLVTGIYRSVAQNGKENCVE